ncbi:unnamed protein product [Penicillium roqueforti FM164]|uniref:Genomic scaffold, ProqFM164S01 n=1 Tax=Penicillium roqueforti (strain FM164) TaxID=1365484 RepID=W6Q0P1_PENRF|nr:unnamed protein product [Penicillium roqueforti FM164]
MMWEWLVHLYAPNATVMAEPREYLKIFLGRKTGRYSPTPLIYASSLLEIAE